MSHLIKMLMLFVLCAFAGCADRELPAEQASDNQQVRDRGANKDNWWDKLPRPQWAAFEKIPQDQDWFEVYRVADQVYAIYEPGQFEEVMSFLIIGSDSALLFDTGLGIGDMRRVVDQLTEKPVAVLNSHTHYDHIGGNYQFDVIYGRDIEYTRGRAAGSDPAAVAGFLREGWVWKDLPPGFDKAAYRSRPFSISRVVDEGDEIDLGDRRLRVLLTPGHAPDSISLLDTGNRMLFTGDTFYLAPLYTHLEGSDFDDYAESATRLAELVDEIDSVMTSHNVPVVEPRYMTALDAAFRAIRAGTATDVTETDGFREYAFGDFSIIVREEGQRAGE